MILANYVETRPDGFFSVVSGGWGQLCPTELPWELPFAVPRGGGG